MNILCYGDSNTWGQIPNINGYSKNAVIQRYDERDCWWYPLKQGNNLHINGVCGRCIANDSKWLPGRNSSATIMNDLSQYTQLDLVIVQLGTNDCKSEYGNSPNDITVNLNSLLRTIKQQTSAKILVISPARIIENNKITQKYYVGANEKSSRLDTLYKQLCKDKGFMFVSGLDLEVGEDGEHLTKLGHYHLATRVFSKVADFLSENEE